MSFEFVYRHWNQVYTKRENLFSTSLESKQKQGREQMQFTAVEIFIYLFIWLIKPCLCVKDATCLRMAIPAYYFSIFGSIFGVLFCLLIKKFILRCSTIWQSIRKFLWTVGIVSTFSHMDKQEKFLSSKLHIVMV